MAAEIISDGGGATAEIEVAENTTAVTTVTATGDGTLIYTIEGGDDLGLFSIDSQSGVLTFTEAPDYENPADANEDGVYTVVVVASDDFSFDSQELSVTVTNAADNDSLGISSLKATHIQQIYE